jgi:hypothetical protein
LSVVAERIHLAKARIEIEQLCHRAQALAEILQRRGDPAHLPEKAVRKDVAIEVDQGGTVARAHKVSLVIICCRAFF